ncbi:MAG: hypothetical protein HWD83_00420 [Gammaproteobacteria bacterium]|nr:hypothetical protein [Gammaproteobacteria bacterium]
MTELLAIFGIFVAPAMVIAYYIKSRTTARLAIQETVRLAIEKGQQLSPDTIESFMKKPRNTNDDFRSALVFGAIGISTIVIGFVYGDLIAARYIGLIPLAVGIAYAINWKMGKTTA